MPKRSTKNPEAGRRLGDPVIFFHATHSAAADRNWVKSLVAMGMPVYSHLAFSGCSKTHNCISHLGQLLGELAADAPRSPVIIIQAGLHLQSDQLKEIARTIESEGALVARTVLSNALPGVNPFAGLRGDAKVGSERLAAIVDLVGPGQEHEYVLWPGHFVALSAAAVSALSDPVVSSRNALAFLHDSGGRLTLSDRLFVHAPALPLFNTKQLEPHESPRPPSWGALSAHLQSWFDARCPELRGPDGEKAVTLHITHSWGGGVAQWIRTFIEYDTHCHHLQLRSEGPQNGQGYGQRLSLYVADQLDCPLGNWWLQPPIQSVHESNAHYQQVLTGICQRYGVGRIIVSSLVGHALDALRTGLPTIQILHDHFPVWPFLSANPAAYTNAKGEADLAAALADERLNNEFPNHSLTSWLSLRDEYLSALSQNEVRIAAPSQAVIDLQKTLDSRWRDIAVELIPHGFPPLKIDAPIVPRPRRDKRLRLVILGRIQAGKGQQLLLDALPDLQPHAQVYLFGTGKNGARFFGHPGVNVVIDYQREELPDLLSTIGPDLAALLSIVPETYSYTLSELQHMGVPTIATNRGSFPERIEDGENGWLIEPTARALVKCIASLASEPKLLAKVRETLKNQSSNSMGAMISAYQALCPPLPATPATVTRESSLAQTQASSAIHAAVMDQVALLSARRKKAELDQELEKRTQWAQKANRQVKRAQQRSEALEQQVEERTKWAQKANRQVKRAQQRSEVLEQQVEERTQWAQDVSRALEEEQHRRQEWVGRLESALQDRQAELSEARRVLEKSDLQLNQARQDLEQLQQVHDQVLASSSWKITRPLRVLRRTGQNFMQSRAWNPLRWPLLVSGLVRNLSTVGLHGTAMRMQFAGYQAPPEPLPIEQVEAIGDPNPPESVPYSERPLLSIVIPVYNNWVYTAACLRSIAQARCSHRFEVIVVDDESTDETPESLNKIKGVQNIRNTQNMGFIGSCNRGAEQARGQYLVLLNNDTQVLDGWLDTLLDTFALFPSAGLVGSRLVYPDGRLQECGGMVFQDGSGWNYGRGDNPQRPEYLHVREVDYCSGACFMIETQLFRELGGFDDAYRPAYYEDTDLAFRVRAAGRKVLVQPASTVIHHEGISSGTVTDSGTKRYQLVNQEKFLQRWRSELANYPPRIEDPTNPSVVRAARDHHLRGRVLIIDATTPEPDQDSGSVRLTHLMRCFHDLGYRVTFFADNHAHAGRYTRDLQRWGIEVLYEPWLESNQAFFRQHGSEFDVILVSRHYVAANYLSLVKRYCPQASFIFDTVDLHYLREQRLAELENSLPLRRVASQTRRSELSVIAQSDAVLVVSSAEVVVLAQDAPQARVHVLSNIHDVVGRTIEFADRKDLFFVGGYQHPPNVDAAHWFVTKIWPLIHARLPEAKFHLIGSKAPNKVRALKGEGVIFHGFVKDLDHYLDHCTLAVAPLRYGAGVKGKVNMSMSHGQPVVATPTAIEGLHAEHEREILVADTEQSFADEVIRLYRDEALWNAISDAAIENVEAHFSVRAARNSLEDLLDQLNTRPDQA